MLKSITGKNRGITLIALVITIIVLLILAGISISMLTGQNGILKRAAESKENTKQSQKEEILKIAVMDALSQGLGNITSDNLQTALNNNFGNGKYEFIEANDSYTVTIEGKGFYINKSGQILPISADGEKADTAIKNPESYGENPNAQATADGAGKYFAKPDGATYEYGTVDTGVVVTIKGSKFVWVPVDDVVLDKSRDADLPQSSDEGTSSGKIYTPMAVKVGNDYKGILYEFSGSNSYLKYNNSENNYLGDSSEYREPDVVSTYDGTDVDTVEGKITEDKLKSEYNAMIASVLKYKGFYVAQYEAGLDENNNIVFKDASAEGSKITTTNAANTETSSWYGLYKKIKTFTKDSDNVVSSMIWGSQYDAMMNWMAKNGKTVGTADSTKTNTDKKKVTGSSTDDVLNNVYDLYGCHRELTLETYSTGHRAGRGGICSLGSSPANRIAVNPNYTSSVDSSRATLYIE